MKHNRLIVLSLILCLLLAACGRAAKTDNRPEQTPPDSHEDRSATIREKSTLVIAIEDEVEGLDVQQISYGNVVHILITEPLVTYNPDLTELCPAFAEDYTLTDDYIEFVLPADAKFSNGNKLDAAAVKASTERFLAYSPYAGDWIR